MKKFLILIILAALGYFFFLRGNLVKVVTDNTPRQNKSFHPDLAGTIFSGAENATLLEEKAYGDLNNDIKEDTVVFLAESGGGSGIFIYAAAYVSGPVNYKATDAVFLGDRVSPQSISVKNGMATITYLDRKPDEPLAAEPTVPASKSFIYKDGELVER